MGGWRGLQKDGIHWDGNISCNRILVCGGTIQNIPTGIKDIANKEYVDAAVLADDLWLRSGGGGTTQLSPKNAGDDLIITGDITGEDLTLSKDVNFTDNSKGLQWANGAELSSDAAGDIDFNPIRRIDINAGNSTLVMKIDGRNNLDMSLDKNLIGGSARLIFSTNDTTDYAINADNSKFIIEDASNTLFEISGGNFDFQAGNITTTGTVQGVTQAEFDTLTNDSIADALHRHSELVASDGTPDPALTVDAAGKVGINATSPAYYLDINAGGTLEGMRVYSSTYVVHDFQVDSATLVARGMFRGQKSRGTKASPLAVTNGHYLFSILGAGWDGAGYDTDCEIDLIATETHNASAHGAKIQFQTTDNTTTTQDIRLIIDQNGDIIMGAAATNLISDYTGNTYWTGAGTGLPYGSCYGDHIGWSQATATQNTWYNISDADMVDGELNLVTHDSSGKLTVLKAGRYLINYSITWEDNTANDHTEVGIEITGSGSANAAGVTHSETKFANEEQTQSGTAIISLAANATIEIAIRTTDNNTPTIAVQDLNITAVQVGG